MNDVTVPQIIDIILSGKWAALGGIICMVFVTLLTDRTKVLTVWNSPWRTVLGTLFGAGGMALSQIDTGNDVGKTIVNVLVAALPTLIAELTAARSGKTSGPTGTGSIDLRKNGPSIPPAPKTPNISAIVIYGDSRVAEKRIRVEFARLFRTPALLALVLAVSVSGCAAWQKSVQPALSDVQVYVEDAQQILAIVQALESAFFLAHAAPDVQSKVDKAIGDAELGLDSAVRSLQGVTSASQEQLDAAWADFKAAWADLRTLLKDVGIDAPQFGLGLKTAHGTVRAIPEPLVMRGK